MTFKKKTLSIALGGVMMCAATVASALNYKVVDANGAVVGPVHHVYLSASVLYTLPDGRFTSLNIDKEGYTGFVQVQYTSPDCVGDEYLQVVDVGNYDSQFAIDTIVRSGNMYAPTIGAPVESKQIYSVHTEFAGSSNCDSPVNYTSNVVPIEFVLDLNSLYTLPFSMVEVPVVIKGPKK